MNKIVDVYSGYQQQTTSLEPEYLIEEDNHLFNKAMYKMGIGYVSAVGVGAFFGGIRGLWKAPRGSAFKIKMNQMLNGAGKTSITTANKTAAALLMFNAIELGLNAIRDVEENAEDTIAAGAITGALFRSSTLKPRRIIIGGILGGVLGFGYALYSNEHWRNKIKAPFEEKINELKEKYLFTVPQNK